MFCINWLRLTNSWQKFMDDLFRMQQSNNHNASKTYPVCSASYSVYCASPLSPLEPATQRAKNGFSHHHQDYYYYIYIYIFMYYHLMMLMLITISMGHGFQLANCQVFGFIVRPSLRRSSRVHGSGVSMGFEQSSSGLIGNFWFLFVFLI